MGLLASITRRRLRPKPYLPFTERPWTGGYPVGAPRRFTSRKTNPYLMPGYLGQIGLSAARRRSVLSQFEDRRTWHPQGVFAPAKSIVESYPRMMELPPEFAPSWPARFPDVPRRIDFRPKVLEQAQLQPMKYGFANPLKVIICLKRKIRKEVLHALGIAGKTGFKTPTYNAYSRVRC